MAKLSEIVPSNYARLIDLVQAAGVNVSDWGNFTGGEKKAASNPKYCYEWSFVEPGKVVVLTLWHDGLKEDAGGGITRELNEREFARKRPSPEKERAERADAAVQTAIRENLPIRVILLGGKRRDINIAGEAASRVERRFLDPVEWAVAKYDWENGDCVLKRGGDRFVDQFSMDGEKDQPPERRTVQAQVFIRSAEVRKEVLLRSEGRCEWCGTPGFVTADGRIYLETHHIVPLGENGLDRVSNVTALCANHHRESHHGKERAAMRESLLRRFAS